MDLTGIDATAMKNQHVRWEFRLVEADPESDVNLYLKVEGVAVHGIKMTQDQLWHLSRATQRAVAGLVEH